MRIVFWSTRYNNEAGTTLIEERSIMSDLLREGTLSGDSGTAVDAEAKVIDILAPFDKYQPYATIPIPPAKIDAFGVSVKQNRGGEEDKIPFSPIKMTVKLNDKTFPDVTWSITHRLGYGWTPLSGYPTPFPVTVSGVHTLFVTSTPPPPKYLPVTFEFRWMFLYRVP